VNRAARRRQARALVKGQTARKVAYRALLEAEREMSQSTSWWRRLARSVRRWFQARARNLGLRQ
jgi:predicted Zn-dependent protease